MQNLFSELHMDSVRIHCYQSTFWASFNVEKVPNTNIYWTKNRSFEIHTYTYSIRAVHEGKRVLAPLYPTRACDVGSMKMANDTEIRKDYHRKLDGSSRANGSGDLVQNEIYFC